MSEPVAVDADSTAVSETCGGKAQQVTLPADSESSEEKSKGLSSQLEEKIVESGNCEAKGQQVTPPDSESSEEKSNGLSSQLEEKIVRQVEVTLARRGMQNHVVI